MKRLINKAFLMALLSTVLIIDIQGAARIQQSQVPMIPGPQLKQQGAMTPIHNKEVGTITPLDVMLNQLAKAAAQINQFKGTGPKNTGIKNGLLRAMNSDINALFQSKTITEQQKNDLNKHITILAQASATRKTPQAASALKAFEAAIATIKVAAAQKEAATKVAKINMEKVLIEKKEKEGTISHETATKALQQKDVQKNKAMNEFKTKAKAAKEESGYWSTAKSYFFYTPEQAENAQLISKKYPNKIERVREELKAATGKEKKELTAKLAKLEKKLYDAQLITGEKWSTTKYILAGTAGLGALAAGGYIYTVGPTAAMANAGTALTSAKTAIGTAGSALYGYGEGAYTRAKQLGEGAYNRARGYFGYGTQPAAAQQPQTEEQKQQPVAKPDFKAFVNERLNNMSDDEKLRISNDPNAQANLWYEYERMNEGLGAKAWRMGGTALSYSLGLLGAYETFMRVQMAAQHAQSVAGLTPDQAEENAEKGANMLAKTYINPLLKRLPTAARIEAICAIQNPDHIDMMLEKYPQHKTTISQLSQAINEISSRPDIQEQVLNQIMRTLSTKDRAAVQACTNNNEEEEGEEEENEEEITE